MIKFYTNPPIKYPYELILFDNFKEDKINPSHEYILDSGVYRYKDKIIETGDYPNLEKYKILDYIPPFPNVEIVIPDYPCDFLGNDKKWIEKTFRNIEFFITRFAGHRLLPTIQSYFGDFTSLVNSFERFIKDYPTIKRIAIGNLCIMRKMKIYRQMERYLRPYMKKGYYFHIFGMNLGALKYFKDWKCLSWDGMKWTRPVNKSLPNHSCKNKEERILFFQEYLKTINNYLKHPTITLADCGEI